VRILNRFKIKAKLGLLLAVSALSLVATIVLGASFLYHKIVADREDQTHRLVETAVSIVQSWYDQEQSGKLSRWQAQAGAIAALRPLRYGNNDYFFIQSYDGIVVLNPNLPKVEGLNRADYRDPDGVARVQLQIDQAKKGGGVVYYRMPRGGGADQQIPKVSYIAGFDPWRWAIGTGVYIDDIAAEFLTVLTQLILIASAIFGGAMVCAYFVNHNISAALGRLALLMERLAAGDLSVEIDEAERKDEIGEMGKAMRVFKLNAIAARSLEAEREKRRELEMAVNHAGRVDALGRLAGGIAHDLNNALVPVLAMTKLVLSRMKAQTREYANLELVLMGAERAKELVQQILAFSRKQGIEQREFDLGRVVGDAVKMLRASFPPTLMLETDINPIPAVYGDPGQLNQVLVNLVTNGAHAIGEKPGTVTISLHADDEDGYIRLAVADTGAGMDEATRARMFEPFFTTKEVGKGTGLGLSVVHGIITAHAGQISVQSERGKGTRIDIVLPIAERRKADADAVAA
jgi:signal transduction histidine kinase